MPAAVATVFGGRGSERPWKNDGMECDDGVVAHFCFPFYNDKWEVGVNNHVSCKCRGGGGERKICNGIGFMCHGGWHCQRRLL